MILQKSFFILRNPTCVAAGTRIVFIGGRKFAIFSLLKNQRNFCYTVSIQRYLCQIIESTLNTRESIGIQFSF